MVTSARFVARLCLLLGIAVTVTDGIGRSLTVEDAIQTVRPMTDQGMNAVFVSPGGQRYAVMLISGDIERDGLWAEIRVGSLESTELAKPALKAKFFTRGLGASGGMGEDRGSPRLTQPWVNIPVWIDDDRLLLLWEDPAGISQIFEVDVVSGRTSQLTNGTADVLSFARSKNGTLLVDAASPPSRVRSLEMMRDGFAVRSPDAMALLSGLFDGSGVADFGNCDRYLKKPTESSSVTVQGSSVFCQTSFLSPSVGEMDIFSSDGRFALINSTATASPQEWQRYTDADFAGLLRQKRENPKDLYAQLVQTLFLVDVRSGKGASLWNAPLNRRRPPTVSWSPDATSILLWPTFLPVAEHSGEDGLAGNAAAVVEIASGDYSVLPLQTSELRSLRWADPLRIMAVFDDGLEKSYKRINGIWKDVSGRPTSPKKGNDHRIMRAPVEVKLRQDMNTPPVLYAVEVATGRTVDIFALNPALGEEIELGRVEFTEWRDSEQNAWKGRLYYPVKYRTDRTYPLVVQTHGYAGPDEFSIYGPGDGAIGLGPGWSVYLAQVLAGVGIAVLQVGGPEQPGPNTDEFTRLRRAIAGLQAGVEHLIALKLVDPDRIGLMGHSSTGRLVEQALLDSKLHYSAAIAADYADGNYVQSALYGWPDFGADINGGKAFGGELHKWISNSPAFNAQRIQTPLQIQVTSAGEGYATLLWGWEMFSRLRYLRKPVEYFVVPDVLHGSHTLQNPRQLRTLQTRALEWWKFWLLDETEHTLRQIDQHSSWRQLRELRDAQLRSPQN